MAYLVASSTRNDLSIVRESPEIWRQVRRFNLPVQLALAAAEDIVEAATDPSTAGIVSLAPCQPGSTELFRWSELVVERLRNGALGDTRMNPTHTLHAVDNLAMSAFAIAHRNRAYCLGFGGAAGQAWAALEALNDRLEQNLLFEAFLIAGDQELTRDAASGLGISILFSTSPRHYGGRLVKLLGVERCRHLHRDKVVPHSAAGLGEWLSAIDRHRHGRLDYVVPLVHSDGIDEVRIVIEVSNA